MMRSYSIEARDGETFYLTGRQYVRALQFLAAIWGLEHVVTLPGAPASSEAMAHTATAGHWEVWHDGVTLTADNGQKGNDNA